MSILFGHPTGNPNSHQAALAHFETGRLEAFCVPWMPTPAELNVVRWIPPLKEFIVRLERRYFPPLLTAPRIQDRFGECIRLLKRITRGAQVEKQLAYEANDWLMQTMKRECRRPAVTAVHAYEDCSLLQFEEAKRLGKACVYDMPIGYYPSWEQTQLELAAKFTDWLPPGGMPSSAWVRPEQKRSEMKLADLVLVPSSFVKETILRFYPEKKIALTPYGVDLEFWQPPSPGSRSTGPLRFIFAGHSSLRKGTPLLLNAWSRAGLKDAQLELVGLWQLASEKRKMLSANVVVTDPLPGDKLRQRYQASDVLVLPSYFEGFGLVILEAMACGLPVLATEATAGPDLLAAETGRVIPTGDIDALVESLRWFADHRDQTPAMKIAARAKAETCTWSHYRHCLNEAVASV